MGRAFLVLLLLFAVVSLGGHPDSAHPAKSLARRAEKLCPTGSFECVGYCCVGNSCCAHGAEPCCVNEGLCREFENAPLCCVMGKNCGDSLSSASSPSPTSSSASSGSSTSLSTVTSQSSSSNQTSSVTSPPSSLIPTETTVPAEKEGDGKLELSDRIALGVGIAVGVPSALAAIMQMWKQCKRG
ncbi:hypothetical protein BKA70DRAFT_1287725 [Coprinopsis sp. MPI-PUGE-AT-0042]|nr:hypothetical protein BKA70DRAFT_1287725 [Coprinopsis sp. MPI-PUGE-AT-0042]